MPLATTKLAPGTTDMSTRDLRGRLTSILLEDLPHDKRSEFQREFNLDTEPDAVMGPKLQHTETLYGSEEGNLMTKESIQVGGT